MAVVALCGFTLNAQTSINSTTVLPSQKGNDVVRSQNPQPLSSKQEVTVEDWHLFSEDLRQLEAGFRNQASFFSLFPDSYVKNLYLDEDTGRDTSMSPNWHSIGQLFEANDPAWMSADLKGLRDWYGYSIDSISIDYGYIRYSDTSVTDTLVVQLFNDRRITSGTIGLDNGTSEFGIVDFDQDKGIGKNFDRIIKVPLKTAVETPVDARGRFLPQRLTVGFETPLVVPVNGACAATITFKPGIAYSVGDTFIFSDTLVHFGVTPPTKKFNQFGMLIDIQDQYYSVLTGRNNGIFVTSENRYDRPFTGRQAFLNGRYLPNMFTNGDNQLGYYPRIHFKVNAEYNTALEELDGQESSLFPNPGLKGTNARLMLSDAAGAIAVSIIDLTGKEVYQTVETVLQANSLLELQTSHLDSGTYMVKINSGENTYLEKLVITE